MTRWLALVRLLKLVREVALTLTVLCIAGITSPIWLTWAWWQWRKQVQESTGRAAR